MSAGAELRVALPAGEFRALEWPGRKPGAVFLHGLSGLADVWTATAQALGDDRPRCLALDQRGHGDSPRPADGPYGVGAFVGDLLAFMDALGLTRPHLVGHSMGARVAMVAAARHPERFRSVAIVDIGPEAWRANWQTTVAALDRMPERFADAEAALAFAMRRQPLTKEQRAVFMARLHGEEDGGYSWRAEPHAMRQTVRAHRSRNYWREWERLGAPPALLVRGEDSDELRSHVVKAMRVHNASVRYEEFAGVGHNIPLLAPAQLAGALRDFWATTEGM